MVTLEGFKDVSAYCDIHRGRALRPLILSVKKHINEHIADKKANLIKISFSKSMMSYLEMSIISYFSMMSIILRKLGCIGSSSLAPIKMLVAAKHKILFS